MLKTFDGCYGLTSITIPNSVTSIEEWTFAYCRELTSITFSNSVTNIGAWAFYGCYSLTSVILPNSVSSIGESAFEDCAKIETLKLPDNLQIIKKATFKGCQNLQSVIIPSTVEFIYQEAFARNNKMESVKAMPEAPPYLYDDSFSNYNISLYVPSIAMTAYQTKAPWNKFTQFLTLDGEEVEIKQCATPTIAFVDGELIFSCETDGVKYSYEITNADVKNGHEDKVKIGGTYMVSVYATKPGYINSDVATLEFSLGGGGVPCDVNGDGKVDVSDYIGVANYILTGSIYGNGSMTRAAGSRRR